MSFICARSIANSDFADETQVIVDILGYIQKHLNAKESAEGIAKYWIFRQRLEEKYEIVMRAIEYLISNGFLQCLPKNDGTIYIKINKSYSEESTCFRKNSRMSNKTIFNSRAKKGEMPHYDSVLNTEIL
jgi:hypothetical protein